MNRTDNMASMDASTITSSALEHGLSLKAGNQNTNLGRSVGINASSAASSWQGVQSGSRVANKRKVVKQSDSISPVLAEKLNAL